jgi:hypothetical protein
MSAGSSLAAPRLSAAEWTVLLLFLGANVLVPVVWGDIFPFTSSPMFRDAPRVYCIYRVFTPDGRELPAEELLLQRIYDGNPPGYGVGIAPPSTLARFGEVADELQIRQHVGPRILNSEFEFVTVEQEVIACCDGVCRVRETNRIRVERDAP